MFMVTMMMVAPWFAALVLLMMPVSSRCWVLGWTLLVELGIAVVTLGMGYHFPQGSTEILWSYHYPWIEPLGLFYRVGVDGLSMVFLLLTNLLMPLTLLTASSSLDKRMKEYHVFHLLLHGLLIGCFTMLDSLLFYIFFEAALIPLFFMVVLWGGEGRIYASLKLFLYTMAGSLLFLLSLVLVYRTTGTLDMVALPELVEHIPSHWKYWLWGAMFVAFAVKIPMWPVHGWLPDAHVQAPTGASMILAGIVLKLGGYGMIRFCLALFPDISAEMSPWVMGLSLAGLVVASFAAFGHRDIKKIIAYSSVAHMAMVTAGLFTSQIYGIQGAIFQMVSHGVISAGLFAVVGSIYSRLHTRDMGSMGGLAHRMPRLALVTMVLVFGSVGLPGTSGFVGEFLVLLGSFEWHPFLTLGLSLGMVMGAVYMLSWMRGIMFGGYDRDRWGDLRDLAWSEKSVLFPLALATIWLGLAPSFVTHYTSALAERWLPSSRSTVTVTNES